MSQWFLIKLSKKSVPQTTLTFISHVWKSYVSKISSTCKTICHVSKHQHYEGESSSMDDGSQSPQHHIQPIEPIWIAKLKKEKIQTIETISTMSWMVNSTFQMYPKSKQLALRLLLQPPWPNNVREAGICFFFFFEFWVLTFFFILDLVYPLYKKIKL